jgi:hypothetical protein
MTRDELKALVADAQQRESEIRAADTPQNEARLVKLLQSKGITVKGGRQKGPQRYTAKLSNGSIGPVTLFDLERVWDKVSCSESEVHEH